jgi:acetylglutamate kinase
MSLCGKVNKDLVSIINNMGGSAVGLCGVDGGMLRAVKLTRDGTDYGYVGEITEVSTTMITDVTDKGYIPVIATVAQGIDDDCLYNVNADTAAAKIAAELRAEKLILLTDVRGILRDPKDESSLIPVISLADVPGLIRDGIIQGGMIPKLECCVDAIKSGVGRAHILDGRIEHSILIEMLSNEGIGTMLVN